MSGTNPGSTSSPFNQLLEVMARHKASDLFISVGSPVQMKINGNMVAVTAADKRLMPQQAEALLRSAINDQQWRRFQEENELNIGYGVKDVGSFRISLFRQRGTAAAVVRYIPGDIPEFDTLGMPPVLKELILQPRGLFLMVGATGVGKTTTLASLIDYRNANRTGHILTLEDPIEFVFRNQQSIVNQRQIGSDTKDLHTALKSALRQAPDCILIGEIRDMEAMGAAIAYAQSGHLVLATLHANNAAHALNRILSFYAPENRGALLASLAVDSVLAAVCFLGLRAPVDSPSMRYAVTGLLFLHVACLGFSIGNIPAMADKRPLRSKAPMTRGARSANPGMAGPQREWPSARHWTARYSRPSLSLRSWNVNPPAEAAVEAITITAAPFHSTPSAAPTGAARAPHRSATNKVASRRKFVNALDEASKHAVFS